jgi:hypothetical protein
MLTSLITPCRERSRVPNGTWRSRMALHFRIYFTHDIHLFPIHKNTLKYPSYRPAIRNSYSQSSPHPSQPTRPPHRSPNLRSTPTLPPLLPLSSPAPLFSSPPPHFRIYSPHHIRLSQAFFWPWNLLQPSIAKLSRPVSLGPAALQEWATQKLVGASTPQAERNRPTCNLELPSPLYFPLTLSLFLDIFYPRYSLIVTPHKTAKNT